MASFFFNWHAFDFKHFSHTRTRIITAIVFLCALLMLYISLLSRFNADMLTAASILTLPFGLIALARSYRNTQALLLISVLVIEGVAIANTGAILLIPVLLILDAVLAWFLFKKEEV